MAGAGDSKATPPDLKQTGRGAGDSKATPHDLKQTCPVLSQYDGSYSMTDYARVERIMRERKSAVSVLGYQRVKHRYRPRGRAKCRRGVMASTTSTDMKAALARGQAQEAVAVAAAYTAMRRPRAFGLAYVLDPTLKPSPADVPYLEDDPPVLVDWTTDPRE